MRVWGVEWEMKDRAAPKVFSLVGKSASEVREMSGLGVPGGHVHGGACGPHSCSSGSVGPLVGL